jgi:hypothetical protein
MRVMAKIYSPNKQYVGISAGVTFVQGVGEATDEYLIDWFKKHGYEVEEDLKVPDPDDSDPDDNPGAPGEVNEGDLNPDVTSPGTIDLETYSVEELIKFAEDNGIDIGKATSKEGILKKIQEAAEKIEE